MSLSLRDRAAGKGRCSVHDGSATMGTHPPAISTVVALPPHVPHASRPDPQHAPSRSNRGGPPLLHATQHWPSLPTSPAGDAVCQMQRPDTSVVASITISRSMLHTLPHVSTETATDGQHAPDASVTPPAQHPDCPAAHPSVATLQFSPAQPTLHAHTPSQPRSCRGCCSRRRPCTRRSCRPGFAAASIPAGSRTSAPQAIQYLLRLLSRVISGLLLPK